MSIPKSDPIGLLLSKVGETIIKHSMLSPGDRVLVAVSGGPDSVCLLSVLHRLSEELGLTLNIAHLDHRFRGDESAGDAQFVAELAKKLEIPATIEQFDVPAFCRERGLSSQEGARKVRYGFLQQAALDADANRIATGHTADDQAETFLMRLIRGAGVSGLSAIPPVRENIIRPQISVTRDEVLDYLKANALEYRIDPSNAKPLYTRNRIRLEVLPILTRFNPRIVETLASEAALLRDENEAVEMHLATIIENTITRKEDALFAKRDEFAMLPPAFRRRMLRQLVDLAGADSSLLSLDQINNALSFMASAQTGRSMDLPGHITISREYNRFVISKKAAGTAFSYPLAVPGVTSIPVLALEIETVLNENHEASAEDKIYLWQAAFDYDKMGSLLTLRSRQAGDWFRPTGMGGGSKKLQDYFVDEKVPRRQRDAVPLLCAGRDIAWVMGLRTDEGFLAGPETRNVLTVRVRSHS